MGSKKKETFQETPSSLPNSSSQKSYEKLNQLNKVDIFHTQPTTTDSLPAINGNAALKWTKDAETGKWAKQSIVPFQDNDDNYDLQQPNIQY